MLIIVYDITNRSSFERVTDYWYKTKEIMASADTGNQPVVLLIGNKLVSLIFLVYLIFTIFKSPLRT